MLQRADIAMHRAKLQGRDSYQVFTKIMFIEAQRRKSHEDNLRQAIESKQSEIYFQPQVSLDTFELCGVEVLLRSTNPVLANIPTEKLIAVAEDTGLINPLGEWILETACRQIKSWQQMALPRFKVAVNFSPKQFLAPTFLSTVKRILRQSELDPGYLELEVTEGVLMAANETNTEIMAVIKDLGR